MMKAICVLVIVALLLGLSGLWMHFRYGECKKVGHSTMYCIMTLGD